MTSRADELSHDDEATFNAAKASRDLGQELVHVPRPDDSAEAPDTPEISPYIQVGLDKMITDAAMGAGTVKPEKQSTMQGSSEAHNYSLETPLRNGMNLPVYDTLRDFERHYTSGPSTRGNIEARSAYNVLAGVHVVDDSKTLTITNQTEDGEPALTRITMTFGKDGKPLDGKPQLYQRFGNHVTADRPMHQDEINDVKSLLGDSFGLEYPPPRPLEYHQRPGEHRQFPAEVQEQVIQLIFDLQVQGLGGDGLRHELLRSLHPDATGDRLPFEYADSLDLSYPYKAK